jgi:hypothetical protein
MRARVLSAVSILGAIAIAALALAGAVPSNFDDMFIVLVYARHFVKSGSIYWNAGAGHVDGFTSILDMVVKAISIAIAPADPLRNAHALSIAFDLASVALGGALAFRAARGGSTRALAMATIGAIALGANLALAQAASYVLETPLFATLATAALYTALFARPDSGAVGGAAAALWTLLGLARPEGIPLAILFASAHLVRARSGPRIARLAPPAAFALALLTYHGWHLYYFGALAPNTFYAKSSDSRWSEITDGARYVLAYATSPARSVAMALLFIAPAVGLVKRVWASAEARWRFALASSCATLLALEVVVAGGDSYTGGRFLAVPLDLLVVALVIAGVGLGRGVWVLAGAPLVFLAIEGGTQSCTHLSTRLARMESWPMSLSKTFGCEMAAASFIARRVDTASETDFQRLKFYEDGLDVTDLVGLNEQARAHAPTSGMVLWGKGGMEAGPRANAEVMQLGTRAVTRQPMATHSAREIVASGPLSKFFLGAALSGRTQDELVQRYLPASIPICGVFLNVFVRKDRADRFVDGAQVGTSD